MACPSELDGKSRKSDINKTKQNTLVFSFKEVREETTVYIEIVRKVMVTSAVPWEKKISNLLAQGSWENSCGGKLLM